MREFDLDLLIGKEVVVNCKTIDEEQEFLKFLDSKGIEWNSGFGIFKSCIYDYSEFKETTCFLLKTGMLQYSPISWYQKEGYKILSLDDLVIKPKNNFKEYGFEADFEGHIYERDRTYLLGKIRFDYDIKLFRWDYKTGICRENENYNLKPIKKEWYENPDNFPCIATKDGKNFAVIESIDYLKRVCIYQHMVNFRPATKEEVLSLLVEK